MRLRTSLILVAIALLTVVSSASSRAPWEAKPEADAISGEWETVITGPNRTVKLTLKLTLEGEKVTGTFESPHLGNGVLSNGSWANNELKIKVETNHAPLELTGTLQDGKLAGEWEANQMKGKWEAKKKYRE